jgi:nitrogen regulatory protein P-II 1
MKLVTAILQPSALPAVQEALAGFGVGGLTVSAVEEFTGERHVEVYRARTLVAQTAQRLRLEIAVSDDDAGDVVRVIASAARAGRGDPGRVWTQPILEIVRIRTRERGINAL